ncbi:MAG: 4Fe-4S double cluster binding domain-containing protein [Desulfobacterales bacterium]|nr:4Fe-4S double cluster binding domain-containing protein [Desulfobacterales bacterium]
MMYTSPSSKAVLKQTASQGIRTKIVSIEHVMDLESEIMSLYQKKLLDSDLYDAYLASFDFACHKRLKGAQSLIVATIPQPQVKVIFSRKDKTYPVVVPPAYCFAIDNEVADFLKADLEPLGYHLRKVRLPDKLLAVRSGLAQYGKNNITYVKGMGSFHRPVVFISDFPCQTDSWGEATVLDNCENCSACLKACPTKAIGSGRFQLHAERCLTFFNESSRDFPDWLSPAWHNSLVGCMICQKVCPANKDIVKWIEDGATFDNEETDLILKGASERELSVETIEKLRKSGIMDYSTVLGRNLKALIQQQN